MSSPTLSVWLGGISYGLYLWHIPAAELIDHYTNLPLALEAAARVGSGLLLAVLSMKLIERPFLELKDRLSERDRPRLQPTS